MFDSQQECGVLVNPKTFRPNCGFSYSSGVNLFFTKNDERIALGG